MDFLKQGLKKVIEAIKANKLLFITLFILQTIFLITISYASLHYQMEILEDARGIIEPLQNANYDPDSIQDGNPFLQDPLTVYKSYKSLINNILFMDLWLLFIFIIINGLIWTLCHQLLEGKSKLFSNLKNLGFIWSRFIIFSLILLSPLLILFYFILTRTLTFGISPQFFATLSIIILCSYFVIYYFLLVSFAFIDEKRIKKLLHNIFTVAFKKIHFTLIVLVINLILIFINGYLIYLTFNKLQFFPLTLLLTIILITTLVLTKIFWIVCLKEIIRDKK